jgi:5-methylcytosine-specific restriction endonuclease McrA
MPFSKKNKEEILVKTRRSCCICHIFIGRNANVHHIVQEADGGENSIENAIVLCPNCHAEAGHYNPKHPLGNKYSPEELIMHRDKWID